MSAFKSIIKNPKTTLGGIAALLFAAFTLVGGLSEGLGSVDWEILGQSLMEAAIGFGLLAARDADKSSEDQRGR